MCHAQVTPERAQALEHLLKQDCGSCHGLTLKGGLGPALTRDVMQSRTVEAVQQIILLGVPGTAMPPWAPLLTEQESRWLAERLVNGSADDAVE